MKKYWNNATNILFFYRIILIELIHSHGEHLGHIASTMIRSECMNEEARATTARASPIIMR